MRSYLVIAPALFLASCQTDDRFERLHPYIGTNMADWRIVAINATGPC
jgi:hypothetical protein